MESQVNLEVTEIYIQSAQDQLFLVVTCPELNQPVVVNLPDLAKLKSFVDVLDGAKFSEVKYMRGFIMENVLVGLGHIVKDRKFYFQEPSVEDNIEEVRQEVVEE